MEHLCSQTLVSLCQQLEARFIGGNNAGKTCDLADWIEYFAWDMDGEMTFSKPLGFLEAGSDHSGIIGSTERCQQYFGVVGQMPWLDMWLGKSPRCPVKFSTFAGTAGYCVQRLAERLSSGKQKDQPADFLDHYLEAKEQYPGVVTENEVIGYLILNVSVCGYLAFSLDLLIQCCVADACRRRYYRVGDKSNSLPRSLQP